ncbi:hypothetical protein YC2023_108066 [Brassica napus]
MNATWLILPVVICLSQRLSHACDPLEGKSGASSRGNSSSNSHRSDCLFCWRYAPGLNWPGRASGAVTLKKLECSKQAYALYTLAWDNIIGFRSYCVGLRDRSNDYQGQSGAFVFHSQRRTTAKAFAKDVFINQERKLGARRRSDTVLVSTINDADQGSADVAFRTPLAPYEKSKFLGSGGELTEGHHQEWSLRLNLTQHGETYQV